ncbi:hypothetical protein [Azospirillum argentinense]|uniref:hypothetical protein n=1 Tax=Azospirillum argentinense TaxID=2970906 RepID=UPI0032DFFA83
MNKKARSKVAAKKLKLRAQLWPELDEARLWHRSEKVGFVTIPRAMPLILGIMDDMSKNKPVSSTYFDLWCRTYDDSFVVISKPREHAFSSGFTGQRAEGAWAARMRILENLGFIAVQPGPSGPMNYVLIWNPYEVIHKHKINRNEVIRDDSWNALQQRVVEIGADDLEIEENEAAGEVISQGDGQLAKIGWPARARERA